MSRLNTAWMLQTFILAAQQTASGSFMEADTAVAEINDLVERKYLKLNKKLMNEGTVVGAVVVKGAYAEDLIADLGLDYDTAILSVPADLRKPADVAEVPTTPAPVAQFEQPAVVQATEQPVFADTPAPVPQSTGMAVNTGTETTPHVVEVVERREKSIAIAVGVSYSAPAKNNLAQRAPQEEAYPYKEIVDLKIAHPNETPSFHVVGKETKDVSGMIRRHALRYEKSHNVTFRAQTVGADDINGAGVRVFALSMAEAPARPNRKKVTVADAVAETVAEQATE